MKRAAPEQLQGGAAKRPVRCGRALCPVAAPVAPPRARPAPPEPPAARLPAPSAPTGRHGGPLGAGRVPLAPG
jgi:hypothetical protein